MFVAVRGTASVLSNLNYPTVSGQVHDGRARANIRSIWVVRTVVRIDIVWAIVWIDVRTIVWIDVRAIRLIRHKVWLGLSCLGYSDKADYKNHCEQDAFHVSSKVRCSFAGGMVSYLRLRILDTVACQRPYFQPASTQERGQPQFRQASYAKGISVLCLAYCRTQSTRHAAMTFSPISRSQCSEYLKLTCRRVS